MTNLAINLRVSNAELAALIGVDPATVWRWTNSKDPVEPPSHLTQRVVEALERIAERGAADDFFKAVRSNKIRPKTRQMLEAIFQFSAEKRFV
jgi:hypothetical protein